MVVSNRFTNINEMIETMQNDRQKIKVNERSRELSDSSDIRMNNSSILKEKSGGESENENILRKQKDKHKYLS